MDPATIDPGVDLSLIAQCVEEQPGLWYVSSEGGHEYIAERDGIWIRAQAALTADRDTLRAAAVNARRVPPDRLLGVLPPVEGTMWDPSP